MTIFDCFPILGRQRKVNSEIKDVLGERVFTFEQEWELVGANDIYWPYFSKVVKGKVQKKQFTIVCFDREWLLDLIKYNKFSKPGCYRIVKKEGL